MSNASDKALVPFRVLDLTEGGCQLCGKTLADFGADVIQIEPPSGSPTRRLGPFLRDSNVPEKSLVWLAYNANKRGISLDFETPRDRERFRKLAVSADFVVESFAPGYLASLGLDYDALADINPRIILTSITPFGQTGPKSLFKASDLTEWAAGGMLYICGDLDRPPTWIGVPQSEAHAGVEAAAASLIAHWYRQRTGEGQRVDVSIQECVMWTLFNIPLSYDLHRYVYRRSSSEWTFLATGVKYAWNYPCKDGYITFGARGGGMAFHVTSTTNMVRWMAEERAAPLWLQGYDWARDFDMFKLAQDDVDKLEAPFKAFFATKTKAELFEQSLRRNISLAPVNTIKDVYESPQLRARRYWQKLWHDELGEEITYCGPAVIMSETPMALYRRAPRIGEHNAELLDADLQLPPHNRAIPRLYQSGAGVARPSPGKPQAFEGIKIANFAWIGVGPITGKYFADHGATVVRVETHAKPDPARGSGPFKDNIARPDNSAFYANYNSSCYGITLNLNNPKGSEIGWQLAMWADIVIEAFTPGAMQRWGLDYVRLGKAKPDLIYLSTCQLGQTGPQKQYAGYGVLSASLAGFSHIHGWPDRPPMSVRGAYSDFIAPRFATVALLAALEYRERTGKGQHIDQSQFEGCVSLLAPYVMDFASSGRVLGREGNRYPYAAPHGAYPTKGDDEWCAIAVFSDAEWQAFCGAVGRSEWADDPRFVTLEARKEHEDEIDRLVAEWTTLHTAPEVEAILQAAGVAVSKAESSKDLFEDPQLQHRGHYRRLKHSVIGYHAYDAPAFRLSKTPDNQFAGPALGEHNRYVYRELLGLKDEEIANLIAEGVITTEANLPGA